MNASDRRKAILDINAKIEAIEGEHSRIHHRQRKLKALIMKLYADKKEILKH